MFNFGHRVGVFIGEVCTCVCVGGDWDGKWLGDASFTSDFYHARLTHNSIPSCKEHSANTNTLLNIIVLFRPIYI